MSQSRSADAVPSMALATQHEAGPAPAPRRRPLARQLIVLAAIPAVLALALAGLWGTSAARAAGAYGRASRLAALGQQVAGLGQAMADERSGTAAFIARGRRAAGRPALRRQYAITDDRAARVRGLAAQVGRGYPARARAGAARALASIARLPALRSEAARSQVSALAVIAGYSAAAAGLRQAGDGIADLSGDPTLVASTRALGALSGMIDHAAQQQAILGVALAEGRLEPAALTALTSARAAQAGDLTAFRDSATGQESSALTQTLAGPPARQAQAVERRATAGGAGVLALGPRAGQQWSAGMSYTVGWLGHAEQQLAQWITADAQARQRSAMRSAMIAGVAGLAALALVLLGAISAARSVARRRRRAEPSAPDGPGEPRAIGAGADGAGQPLAIGASAVSDGFFWRNHSLLERLLRLIDNLELGEDDPERLASLFEMDHLATRIWRNSDSALVLAGHETPRPAGPLALVDVLRAAVSEIEQYGRVALDVQQGVRVRGSATTDTVHLLAELLENATAFSPETTQVIVSGHAVCGGGSLITITDAGTGLPEEELARLNRQLASPSLADLAAAPHMGLVAVAFLAARHGITVTLGMPPDGGTTAEVYLPAALISPGAEPAGRPARTAPAPLPAAGGTAGATVVDLPFAALRFASGPQPPLGPETDVPEAVPVMLGAPVPSPAPEAGVAAGEPAGPEPGDGPPIFESVRSGYLHAFGRDLLHSGGQQAGPASAGLPQRSPEAGPARGAAADQETRQPPAAESAEIMRSKLASFQRGSRRARTAARMNHGAQQPGQDG